MFFVSINRLINRRWQEKAYKLLADNVLNTTVIKSPINCKISSHTPLKINFKKRFYYLLVNFKPMQCFKPVLNITMLEAEFLVNISVNFYNIAR